MTEATRPRPGPEPTCPPPDPYPTKPRITLPPRSCDSHYHIFGPAHKLPYAPDRTFTPPEAPKDLQQRLHRFLGITCGVVSRSACHGTDHAAVLDALADLQGRYRGVALLDPDTAPAEVARHDAAGFCGVRFHLVPHLGAMPHPDDLRTVMGLVAPHGWHVAIHVFGKELLESLEFIRSIEAPVVIDHMGRVDSAEGPDGEAFNALRGLLDTGKVWVKLSGADRCRSVSPPTATPSCWHARSPVTRRSGCCGGPTGRARTPTAGRPMTARWSTSSPRSRPTTRRGGACWSIIPPSSSASADGLTVAMRPH